MAIKSEVEKAFKLTKKYTDAIIGAQRYIAPEESRPTDSEGKPTNLVGKLYANQGINYNDFKLSWNNKHKVRKIRFTGHDMESEGHPAPDPILLVTRAAVQLQRRTGLKIAAAAEPQDNDGDNDSADLNALAEEEYLEKLRQYEQYKMEELLLGRDIEIRL